MVTIHRRSLLAAGLLSFAATASQLAAPGPAAADNPYTAWWRSRRQANGGAKLLNPLYVAQQRLQEAANLLQNAGAAAGDEVTAALQLVRSSSLNCYLFEPLADDTLETRASLLTQKLGRRVAIEVWVWGRSGWLCRPT
jgi:inorganic triphosphatase YgiF